MTEIRRIDRTSTLAQGDEAHTPKASLESAVTDAHRDAMVRSYATMSRASGSNDPRRFDLRYETYADGAALFLKRSSEASAISIDDVHQGGLDDCYFEAVVAGLANHPKGRAVIDAMMTPLPDGRVRVAFPGAGTVEVDPRQLAMGSAHFGGGEDRVGLLGQRKEEWPVVLEAAYAKAAASTKHLDDSDALLMAGYPLIGNGGLPEWSMQAFGLRTRTMDAVEGSWAPGHFVKEAFDAGSIVVVETDAHPIGDLRADHAYTVVGIGDRNVRLRDPIDGSVHAVAFDALDGAKRVTGGAF